MLLVFWLNILLTALCCGVPWRSKAFIWILLGAASMTPLWDYGFEIRHDNLLLLLLLSYLFCLRLERGDPRLIAGLLGGLSALQLLVVFKSPVHWSPLALLFLVQPPKSWKLSRAWTLLFGSLGFLVVMGTAVGLLKASGWLPFFKDGFSLGLSLATGTPVRFPPWGTFDRLLQQTPMLLGLSATALVFTLTAFREDWRKGGIWATLVPEASLVLINVLILFLHPMPLPYHLCLIIPFAFILGVKWIRAFPDVVSSGKVQAFLWTAVILFAHVIPFFRATLRHLDFTNDRQEELMGLAETMTDSSKDRVYDAAGLVASRQSIGRQWFLHTLFLDRLRRGESPSVRSMLQERPASVLIPNYRFAWLEAEDEAFIKSHYIPLAGDFLVLGQSMVSPKLDFTCLQGGRYHIKAVTPKPGAGVDHLDMDGVKIPVPSIQSLPAGIHVFKAEKGSMVVVGWVGPTLKQLPEVSPGDPNRFFINWY
ncbi:MAG: hypothetical protein HY014_09720 [Acidobacteria bacterium]|nr:hypothetical protein [Acidobacteriota bacterium]MBI3488431.1 hypothetical protein [Acidobacteriota bacterium]